MTTSQKFKVISAFDGASPHYETAAGLQRDVAGKLAGRINCLAINESPNLLEIGCGTGFLTKSLMSVLPTANRLISDIAPAMVEHCRASMPADSGAEFIVMDGEQPGTTSGVDGAFDLICASLVFQWFEDLESSIAQLTNMLRPGGHLAFATLVRGTFHEWHAVHQMFGLRAATPAFPSAAIIDGYWPDAGIGSIEEEEILQTYDTAHDFLMILKAIGATTPKHDHEPLPAGSLRRILRHLDQQGSLTITYQVAYGVFTRQ
ncbi:MAG: methyltransferase domain-containing protein [Rhodospirillales bacterium]|jgi:malonyl-CoA O-methyltransferase